MAARNLDGELDGVGTPRSVAEPISVGMDTFVEVSQIAEEAVRDVMPQPSAPMPEPLPTTTDVVDAHVSII
jgi:predicted secreted protein